MVRLRTRFREALIQRKDFDPKNGKWLFGIWCPDEMLKWAFGKGYGKRVACDAFMEAARKCGIPPKTEVREGLTLIKQRWEEEVK